RAETWRPYSAANWRPTLAWPGSFAGFLRRLGHCLRAWALAEIGAGRLVPWLAIGFGAGIGLYFTAAREPGPLAGVLVAGIAICGCPICETAPNRLSTRTRRCRRCRRLRDGYPQARNHRPSGGPVPGLERRDCRVRRDTRRARTLRSYRCPCQPHRG